MENGHGRTIIVIGDAGQTIAFARQMPRPTRIGQSLADMRTAVATAYRLTDLGTLGGPASCPFGINAAGQVAGRSTTATGAAHAFLYDGRTMRDLGAINGNYSCAYGINDLGQVVGCSGVNDNNCHAFLYSGGVLKDLGAPGGTGSLRQWHQC